MTAVALLPVAVANGISLVRLLARQHRSAADTLTKDGDEDAVLHRDTAACLDAVADAVERPQPDGVTITEAQQKEVAEAWERLRNILRDDDDWLRMGRALQPILGDHK